MKEDFRPPENKPVNSLFSYVFFLIKFIFGFQFATIYLDLKKNLRGLKGKVLEAGAGAMPYRHLIPKQCSYKALDWTGAKRYFSYDQENVDYFNGKKFPYKNSEFDFVFHVEVLEHVWDYRLFLSECCRILKKNGKMFFTVPFSARWHYIPIDYWRFTESSLYKLCKELNFKNIKITTRGTDINVMLYKMITILFRLINLKQKKYLSEIIIKLLLGILFFIPIIILSFFHWICYFLKTGSTNDTLGYTVIAQKK